MGVKNISGNWIVRNLLLAIAAVVALVALVSVSLSLVTRHNSEITVPDFAFMTFEQAASKAESLGLVAEHLDSVYVRNMKKGVVFSQNPRAGARVKKGRRIFITTNSKVSLKVSMPSLVGCSLRQARSMLKSKTLSVGKLIYRSDLAGNCVLEQRYRGAQIDPGRMVNSGSTIDLVVGLSEEDAKTYIPNLKGMKYPNAVEALLDNSLNVSRINFDRSIRTASDSLSAVVYMQDPEPDSTMVVKGTGVTIYLKVLSE